MKKIFLILFILIVSILAYFYFFYRNESLISLLETTEEEEFYIDNYSIFGQHLNISGCIDEVIDNDLSLVLKNEEEDIVLGGNFYKNENRTCFKISDKINDGIFLDDLKIGSYLLLVRENDNENLKYYTLQNKTKYENLEYYTVTRNDKNNKINIIFDISKEKNYVEFKIEEEKLKDDVYDIVIDPGHGGKDVGSSGTLDGTTYYESDLTLDIALSLKEKLERLGLKVKLTREDDTYLEPYGDGGRALLPNYYKSKYSISLHLNSAYGNMNYGGVEVYTPNDINYDFSIILANNVAEIVGYSKKGTDKISNGVYYTYFTKQDIENSNSEMLEKNMKPYDIKENSPYMYMIREVGGINTGAYIDGRNDYYGLNNYYNSNITAEPYLIEMAYINYNKDLNKLIKDKEDFAEAICDSISEYLNIS